MLGIEAVEIEVENGQSFMLSVLIVYILVLKIQCLQADAEVFKGTPTHSF